MIGLRAVVGHDRVRHGEEGSRPNRRPGRSPDANGTANLAAPRGGESTAAGPTPDVLLHLQRTAGNTVVARLLANDRSAGRSPLRADRKPPDARYDPVVARLPPGPERERCMEWLTGAEDPDDVRQPLTNRDAGYTVHPDHAAKRFVAANGTSWVVIYHFGRRRFKDPEEARRFIDQKSEEAYRRWLRGARVTARQLCEQMDVPPPAPKARIVTLKPTKRGAPKKGRPDAARKPSREPPPIEQPLVIDGFPFNGWTLPRSGRGRERLELLCSLPMEVRVAIRITRIEGHTDHVPVRRYGHRRFRSLGELSERRAEAVRRRLEAAGFILPAANELMADTKARVARTASNQERAVDRKVVVQWEMAGP